MCRHIDDQDEPSFGALCGDCGNVYFPSEWRWPFLCDPCAERDVVATKILSQSVPLDRVS